MPEASSTTLRRASMVIAEVGVIGVAALIVAFVVLQLWRGDLGVPFAYSGGDSNFNIMLVKGVIENGWFLHNPDIGFPLGQNLLDYPSSADNLHFLAFRVLAIFTSDPAVVLNVFYVLTYPVVAMTAYLVLRLMGRTRAAAGVFALLFTFLPYHLFRGENHVFLSGYEGIPLACLLLYWVFQPKPLLLDGSARGVRIARNKRALAAVVMALALGATGAYYGVFAALLLMTAGAVGLVARWQWQRSVSALAIGALVAASLVANLSPTIWYRLTHGTNEEVTHDKPEATEHFGLKIGQLVLPVQGHRIDKLAEYQRRSYNPVQPSEGGQQLGAVGAAGFLGLLLWSLVRLVRRDPVAADDAVAPLAFATIVSAFVGAIGGFSLVLALAGLTEMRSWNRMSLVIAFSSFAFVALQLERTVARLKGRRPGDMRVGAALAVALPLFLVGALMDETTTAALPRYGAAKQTFERDRAFVREVEARLPRRAAVFQLPYIPFPETPPRFGMIDYDHIRGYVHSRDLKWSYGEVKGRNGNWQDGVSKLPLDEMVPALIGVGFSGLWIDSFGYEDRGDRITADVIELIGPPALTSDDRRYRVFDLSGVRERLAQRPGLHRIRAAGEAALRPVLTTFSKQWSPSEYRDGHTVRTATGNATITLSNSIDHARSITLRFLVKGTGADDELIYTTPDGGGNVPISADLQPAAIRLKLPPGDSIIRFSGNVTFTVGDVSPDDDAIAAARMTPV